MYIWGILLLTGWLGLGYGASVRWGVRPKSPYRRLMWPATEGLGGGSCGGPVLPAVSPQRRDNGMTTIVEGASRP